MKAEVTIVEGYPNATFINVFKVAPENQAEVARLLTAANDEVMCKIPGFITSTVHTSDDGAMVINYVQWESKHSFLQIFKYPQAIPHMKAVTPLVLASERHFFDVGRVQLPTPDEAFTIPASATPAVPSLASTYQDRAGASHAGG